VGGLSTWATQWVQRQRPMWREHDANLASIWRRDDVIGRPVVVPDVIVLPDIVSLTAPVRSLVPGSAGPSAAPTTSISLADSEDAARVG
jgi:hypothetical protein